jgi:hypothetical protein
MASDRSYLSGLPEDVDQQIQAYADQFPAVTVERVLRDIARLVCIRRLLDEGILNEHLVLCGGMAMRCHGSTRYTVFDTDTSARRKVSDDDLAHALTFEDDDIAIHPDSTWRWTENKGVRTAQPIHYRADFSLLDAGDATFSLSVSTRGLVRRAEWMPLVHGYPFALWDPNDVVRVPVMHRLEMLAEKLVAWWLFGNAKHLFDIAYLGGRIASDGNPDDDEPPLEALVERKLEANLRLGAATRDRVEALDDAARRQRLEAPFDYLDPARGFDSIAYVGPQPLRTGVVVDIVRSAVVPLLWS